MTVACALPLLPMLVISLAAKDCRLEWAGAWWNARLQKLDESEWLRGMSTEHQVYWPPVNEEGKAECGR